VLTLAVMGSFLTVSCSGADACGYGQFPDGQPFGADACGYGQFPDGQLFGADACGYGLFPDGQMFGSLTLAVRGSFLTVRCSVMQLFDVVLCQIEV